MGTSPKGAGHSSCFLRRIRSSNNYLYKPQTSAAALPRSSESCRIVPKRRTELSIEDELLSLARERERASEAALATMWIEHPGKLRRQLRSDLARQVDLGRLKHSDDKVVQLSPPIDNRQELVCPSVQFRSDSELNFQIDLEERQEGWLVKRFKFHLHLPGRRVLMVRIHLNERVGHDPVTVPRCHFHIDDSSAHIPFPIISPRLMVALAPWPDTNS